MDEASGAANVGDGIVLCWVLAVADASNHSSGINITAKRARLFLSMTSRPRASRGDPDFAGARFVSPGWNNFVTESWIGQYNARHKFGRLEVRFSNRTPIPTLMQR